MPERADTKGMTDNFGFVNDPHMKAVSENADRFNLVKGRYEFYIRRDTVDVGEGGTIVYHVDSTLFVNKFLKSKQ